MIRQISDNDVFNDILWKKKKKKQGWRNMTRRTIPFCFHSSRLTRYYIRSSGCCSYTSTETTLPYIIHCSAWNSADSNWSNVTGRLSRSRLGQSFTTVRSGHNASGETLLVYPLSTNDTIKLNLVHTRPKVFRLCYNIVFSFSLRQRNGIYLAF